MEVFNIGKPLHIRSQACQFICIKNTGVHLKNPYPTNNSFSDYFRKIFIAGSKRHIENSLITFEKGI